MPTPPTPSAEDERRLGVIRFGLHRLVHSTDALTVLRRAGLHAWAFPGESDAAVVLYVEADPDQRPAVARLLHGVDPGVVAL